MNAYIVEPLRYRIFIEYENHKRMRLRSFLMPIYLTSVVDQICYNGFKKNSGWIHISQLKKGKSLVLLKDQILLIILWH